MKKFKITYFSLLVLLLLSGVCGAESMTWIRVPNKSSHTVKKDWLYETGALTSSGQIVGKYIFQERFSPRKIKSDKTAEFLMVVTFSGENEQSIVLKGMHDYRVKQYQGSITAASSAKSSLIGYQMSGDEKNGLITISRSSTGNLTAATKAETGDELGTVEEKTQVLAMVSQRLGVPVERLVIVDRAVMSQHSIRSFIVFDRMSRKFMEINLYADGSEVSAETIRSIYLGDAPYYIGKVSNNLLGVLKNLSSDQWVDVTVYLSLPDSISLEYAQTDILKRSILDFHSYEWLQSVANYKAHCETAQTPLRAMMAKHGWLFDNRFAQIEPAISLDVCSPVHINLPKSDLELLEAEEQVLQIDKTTLLTNGIGCGSQCPQPLKE